MIPFQLFLLFFCAVCLTAAGSVLIYARKQELLSRWEKIPRAKHAGTVLCAIVIFWCIPNLKPILDSGPDSSDWWMYCLAVIAVILCSCWLDYLFARSLAAFLVLTAHFFLKESFAVNVFPYSACFAVMLFLLGICGMAIAVHPYWFRDWIRLLFRNVRIRIASAAFLILTALSGLLVSLAAFRLK